MTPETIAAIVTTLAIGIVLVVFVDIRARKAIRYVANALRRKLSKQHAEIARQQSELLKQRKEMVRLARVIAKQRQHIAKQAKESDETNHRVLALEARFWKTTVERMLPERPPNTKRSVLFLHNGHYTLGYLAAALRRRGWDAVLISNYPRRIYADLSHNHCEVSLFSNDPREFQSRLRALFELVPERFRMVHFAGSLQWNTNFFRENSERPAKARNEGIWDFRILRDRGVKIGYTISGCLDGVSQSTYKTHKNTCIKCPWELRPDLCADERNSIWGKTLSAMCHLVTVEQDYGHEWRSKPFAYREPLTTALDSNHWHPNLEIPTAWRLPRADDELIILHVVADAATRRFGGRDIKGTAAIISAIDRLQSEGFNVRLEQSTRIPSGGMRYLQAQADVVVDQLVMGRYGETACEAMMLGKPTICHIDRREPTGVAELSCWSHCPLIDATEQSIYPVLKWLLSSPSERVRIGHASRAYAMKWHGAESAARRYEGIYDRVILGLPLNVPEGEIFPPKQVTPSVEGDPTFVK